MTSWASNLSLPLFTCRSLACSSSTSQHTQKSTEKLCPLIFPHKFWTKSPIFVCGILCWKALCPLYPFQRAIPRHNPLIRTKVRERFKFEIEKIEVNEVVWRKSKLSFFSGENNFWLFFMRTKYLMLGTPRRQLVAVWKSLIIGIALQKSSELEWSRWSLSLAIFLYPARVVNFNFTLC